MSAEPTTKVAAELLAWLREERRFWAQTADEDNAPGYIKHGAVSRRDQLDMLLARLPRDLRRIEDEAVEDDHDEERRMAGLLEGVA